MTIHRGDDTKQALIRSGIKLFGESGVKATSTRMLAEHSGANISAIAYHFGGKEGLYLAVIKYIGERISENSQPIIADIRRSLIENLQRNGDSLAREQLIEYAQRLVVGMAKVVVGTTEAKEWVTLIIREQAMPTDAFDFLYDGPMKSLQLIFSELISLALGLARDDDEVKVRCQIIWGQVLGFRVARESFLRHLGVKELGVEHLNIIYRVLAQQVGATLSLPILGKDEK